MERKGLSEADLAKELGVTRQAVNHWTHGKREPKRGVIEAIEELLGTHGELFEKLGQELSRISAEETDFASRYAELDEEGQAIVDAAFRIAEERRRSQ